jgi:hypothetical protein
MLSLIKRYIWAVRYKSAVRKANRMAALFKMTYFVIMLDGRLKVVPKKTLKTLVATRRFRRGTTIQDIEKRALYVAR